MRTADFTRYMRRQRLCVRIHALGPRVLFELISEIERRGLGDLDERLERYAALDPELLALLGGDRFAAPPIHPVAMT
jgi:hypothetical protein